MMPFPVSSLMPAQVGDAAPKTQEASADTEGFGAALLAALAHPIAPAPVLEIPALVAPDLAAAGSAAVAEDAGAEPAAIPAKVSGPDDGGRTPTLPTLSRALAKVVAALFALPDARSAVAPSTKAPIPMPLAAPTDEPLGVATPPATLANASEPLLAALQKALAPARSGVGVQSLTEPAGAELALQIEASSAPTARKAAEEVRSMLAHDLARFDGSNGLRIEIESVETNSEHAGQETTERRLPSSVLAREALAKPTAPVPERSEGAATTVTQPAGRPAATEAPVQPVIDARPENAPVRAAQVAAMAPDAPKTEAPVVSRTPYAAPPPSGDQVTLRFASEDGLEGRLRVAVRGGTVQATVLAPDAESLRRMEGEMAGLRRSLVEQGFTEARVTIRPMPGVASADGRSETNGDPRGRGDHAESRNPERREPDQHSGHRSSRGNTRHHPGREGERS